MSEPTLEQVARDVKLLFARSDRDQERLDALESAGARGEGEHCCLTAGALRRQLSDAQQQLAESRAALAKYQDQWGIAPVHADRLAKARNALERIAENQTMPPQWYSLVAQDALSAASEERDA